MPRTQAIQFLIGSDLLKATGTEQSIARDLLEVAYSPDAAKVKRCDRCRLIGRQKRLVHDVLKDAGQRHRRESGTNRCRSIAEDARNIETMGTLSWLEIAARTRRRAHASQCAEADRQR